MRNRVYETCRVANCPNNSSIIKTWATYFCMDHNCKFGEPGCSCPPPFQLFKFPKTPAKWIKWVAIVNGCDPKMLNYTEFKKPKKEWCVCSRHFLDGRPSPKNEYPTINLGYINTDATLATKSHSFDPFLPLEQNNFDGFAGSLEQSPSQQAMPEVGSSDTEGLNPSAEHGYAKTCAASLTTTSAASLTESSSNVPRKPSKKAKKRKKSSSTVLSPPLKKVKKGLSSQPSLPSAKTVPQTSTSSNTPGIQTYKLIKTEKIFKLMKSVPSVSSTSVQGVPALSSSIQPCSPLKVKIKRALPNAPSSTIAPSAKALKVEIKRALPNAPSSTIVPSAKALKVKIERALPNAPSSTIAPSAKASTTVLNTGGKTGQRSSSVSLSSCSSSIIVRRASASSTVVGPPLESDERKLSPPKPSSSTCSTSVKSALSSSNEPSLSASNRAIKLVKMNTQCDNAKDNNDENCVESNGEESDGLIINEMVISDEESQDPNDDNYYCDNVQGDNVQGCDDCKIKDIEIQWLKERIKALEDLLRIDINLKLNHPKTFQC